MKNINSLCMSTALLISAHFSYISCAEEHESPSIPQITLPPLSDVCQKLHESASTILVKIKKLEEKQATLNTCKSTLEEQRQRLEEFDTQKAYQQSLESFNTIHETAQQERENLRRLYEAAIQAANEKEIRIIQSHKEMRNTRTEMLKEIHIEEANITQGIFRIHGLSPQEATFVAEPTSEPYDRSQLLAQRPAYHSATEQEYANFQEMRSKTLGIRTLLAEKYTARSNNILQPNPHTTSESIVSYTNPSITRLTQIGKKVGCKRTGTVRYSQGGMVAETETDLVAHQEKLSAAKTLAEKLEQEGNTEVAQQLREIIAKNTIKIAEEPTPTTDGAATSTGAASTGLFGLGGFLGFL